MAVALLIGGGVFAAVKVAQPHNHNQTRIAPPGTAPPSTAPPGTVAPNTGPFTGTYTANFDAETDPDGQPRAGATPATETWGIRSVCDSSRCVATASRRSGQTTFVSTLVFDDVGGRWMAVGLGSRTCITTHSYEAWEVFILQPHPDGTFAGEYSTVTSNSCGRKRTVTFTRTGDVDVTSLRDPAGQPPRVVSPAEALHGSYHETVTFADGQKEDYDMVVRTDCLRTGDRCMSFFHSPDSFAPLVFGAGKWTFNRESDEPCPAGGTSHVTDAVEYPLPQSPQDPITLLTGHGRQEETGSPCVSSDYDDKYVRTGD